MDIMADIIKSLLKCAIELNEGIDIVRLAQTERLLRETLEDVRKMQMTYQTDYEKKIRNTNF